MRLSRLVERLALTPGEVSRLPFAGSIWALEHAPRSRRQILELELAGEDDLADILAHAHCSVLGEWRREARQ